MSDRNSVFPAGGPGPGNQAVAVVTPASTALLREPYGHPALQPPLAQDGSIDIRATLLEFWRVLYKRKWLIGGATAASCVVGLASVITTTPLYTSTIRLQVDRNVTKIVDKGEISTFEGSDQEFLRTQYELLQSRAIAERVASLARLGEEDDFFRPRNFSIWSVLKSWLRPAESTDRTNTQDPALLSARNKSAAGVVQGSRQVRPVAGSRLVDVSYSDPKPERAQRIAAAYGEAYVAGNLDKRFQANSYAKTFLEDQIKQLKVKLEDSEKVLLEFAEKEQIVLVTEKSSIAENNLAAAHAALGTIVSERIKNEQLWSQVSSATAINLPQLLTNGVIDGLRARKNELTREYQEKLETFKPSYPSMVQISNKIREIDRQLAAEVATIKDSFKAAFENSRSQEIELKKRVDELREEVLDLQKRSIQYNILKRDVDTNRSLYEGLLNRFKEVDIAGGVGQNNVFVVEPPQIPGAPSSPNISRTLLFALGIGLGIGCAAAYVLERFDDTVRHAGEVERISGLATLGIIPKISADKVEDEMADPNSAISEAYRSLCTALQFSTEVGLPKTLLITSAGPAEGKSYTAVAVARHFAMIGLKVLLVDADMRNPSLHKKLGLDNEIGLSNYLTGSCTPPETFQATQLRQLAFMSSGPLPPNAADLLAGARLHSLLSVGLEVFDLIVLDGPPVMGIADAPLLSSAATGTVFVASAGQARAGAIAGSMQRLQFARGTLIGTVLTKYDHRIAGYGYGYGHSYGAGYNYSYGSAHSYGRPVTTDKAAPAVSSSSGAASG